MAALVDEFADESRRAGPAKRLFGYPPRLAPAPGAITRRQAEVFGLMIAHLCRHGCMPTLREVCEAAGMSKSPNSAMCHYRALERKGLLGRTPGRHPGWRVAGLTESLAPHVAAFAAARLGEVASRA